MTHFNQNNFVRMILTLVGGLLLVVVPMSAGTTIIPFDSRQTYLLTNSDPGALDAIPIDLASLGLSSGMAIELQVTGTVCYYWDGITCHIGFSIPWSVGGVFSSTSQLGPPGILNRVTGAIASDGPPVFTIPTYYGNIPTDIPQDFSIAAIGDSLSGPFTVVTIPNGANFLFVSLNDSFFGDNYSTDLALRIVPEPGTLAMTGAGLLAGIGALRRKMHQ
jgi:hypothetical protein